LGRGMRVFDQPYIRGYTNSTESKDIVNQNGNLALGTLLD